MRDADGIDQEIEFAVRRPHPPSGRPGRPLPSIDDYRYTASGKSEFEVYGQGETRRPLVQASPSFHGNLLSVLDDLVFVHGKDLTVPHHPLTVNHNRLDIAGLSIVDETGGQIQQRR